MEIKRTEAAIEAILFAMGESVELSRIAAAVGQDKDTTRRLLHQIGRASCRERVFRAV